MTEPVHAVLVACGDAKAPDLSRAKDLYTSNYFDLKRRYAETHADLWRIVSAEHGILEPDEVVAPYDTTLDDLGDEEERAWLADVAEDLHELHVEEDVDCWTVLAGGDYLGAVDLIMTKLRVIDVETPTAGRPIGKRMEWLKGQVEQNERVAAAGGRG
jgi:hypothetical protein